MRCSCWKVLFISVIIWKEKIKIIRSWIYMPSGSLEHKFDLPTLCTSLVAVHHTWQMHTKHFIVHLKYPPFITSYITPLFSYTILYTCIYCSLCGCVTVCTAAAVWAVASSPYCSSLVSKGLVGLERCLKESSLFRISNWFMNLWPDHKLWCLYPVHLLDSKTNVYWGIIFNFYHDTSHLLWEALDCCY